MEQLAISYSDIVGAAGRLAGVARRTPVLTSTTANGLAGADLFFKCENFQRMGAFKFRGAYNALAQLTPEQRERGVVAFSSGNHAQAVALSARLLGLKAVIVMPRDAPGAKLEATRQYGGEVVLYDRYTEDHDAIVKGLMAERGLTLIPPYDHPQVMAGQGTAALELIEETGPLDALFVPLGGGGLLSGSAVAARELCPGCAVYGVEPEAGDDGRQSFLAGKIVAIPTPRTIADGAQTLSLGAHTFPVIRALARDIFTVPDAELVRTMRFFAERMKLVVEPTGCLASAAVFGKKAGLAGKKIGVILSGGNADLAQYSKWLEPGPAS